MFHCVYTTFCLSIHLPKDTCVASTFWLLWIMLLWIWVYKYLFQSLLWNILDVDCGKELTDYSLILRLSFWGSAILFSTVAAPFYFTPLCGRIMQLMDLPYFAYLTDGHFNCFYLGLLWTVLLWILVCKFLFKTFFFFHFGSIYLGVELLNHMVIACLYFWEDAKVLYTQIAPFYIYTSNVEGF